MFPQAACAFTASRGLSGTNTFLLETNHFLLCQWLTLMYGTVPHFLAQVKGAVAFPMQSSDRAHHTLIPDELCHTREGTIETLSNSYHISYTGFFAALRKDPVL